MYFMDGEVLSRLNIWSKKELVLGSPFQFGMIPGFSKARNDKIFKFFDKDRQEIVKIAEGRP